MSTTDTVHTASGSAQRMQGSVEIAGRELGPDQPMYVIAELSANHNQQLDRALATIDAAAEAGADAIKLQTYTADTLTLDSDAPPFRVSGGTAWDGKTLYELYSEAFTPWEWHDQLFERARQNGLDCFSSPFDPSAVEFLAARDVPAFKVASMEITDIPLIRLIASQGKPVLISTGIATMPEIQRAVDACVDVGNTDIVLLQCTSGYPTPVDELNLRTIDDMRSRFETNVGLSDHTLDNTAAIVGRALGAVLIEKHFILDRAAGGPDSTFSLEPHEFKSMVEAIRKTELALGAVTYELAPSARVSRLHARSLFVTQDVAVGETITEHNVRSVRPADGLDPAEIDRVLGRRFAQSAIAGTPLSWELIEDPTS